jgi:hypothetical protein
MHPADKAVLRLALGLGLAVPIVYGFALKPEYLVCAGAVAVPCIPGPPIPFLKGAVMAAVIAALLMAGVLMVPLLQMYPVSGVLLTGALLYTVLFAGARSANPLMIWQVAAIVLIPVAGVSTQSLATVFSKGIGLALGLGFLVNAIAHALLPDVPGRAAAPRAGVSPEIAGRHALQATLVIMPAFVLALTDPSFYLSIILKVVTLGQQANTTNARSAGRELVGSTFVGALLAMAVWCGLTMRPNLWMLTLWVVAAGFWAGARLYGVKATSSTPSFWFNVLITMFMLLGPAIEDSAEGKDVYRASAIRISLFLLVALYAWATVWALERWRAARSTRFDEALESGSTSAKER